MHHPTGELPPPLYLLWGRTYSCRNAGLFPLEEDVNRGWSSPSPQGGSGGQVRMRRSSPRLVSLPLEKLQAAGHRPRQADEGADVHAVLALTWSEGMASVHTQIQKLFFYVSKLGTKHLV